MKKFRLDGSDLIESVDFRFLESASPAHQQGACNYEYMRESEALRDAIAKPENKGRGFPTLFLPDLTFSQLGLRLLALRRAGFPKPWKRLTKDSQDRLVSLLAEWREETMWGNKSLGIPPDYPPVVIEPAYEDSLAREHKLPYSSPLEASEPNLFQRSGRKYFRGFILIDEAYNATQAVRCFKEWFRERYGKTKGGGGPKWRNRLKELAVMRIWKHETNQWKRLQLVAEFCRYKGCMKEAAAYKERCNEGGGDEPMSKAAKVEMSSARAEALKHFQDLFPGEKPLNWNDLDEEKS